MNGAPAPDEGLVEVRLVGIPLSIHAEAAEHRDDLMREFLMITAGSQTSEVPARLLELIRTLRERFGAFSEGPMQELEEAFDRGQSTVDLVFQVPVAAAHGARELARLWEEADSFCRMGRTLLTLTTPPHLLEYRRWFLGEFIAQIERGSSPKPWQAHEHEEPAR